MAISSNATGLRPGVVTSTTRPTAPYTGQIIYETDTGYLRVWNGSVWDYLSQKQGYTAGLTTGKVLQVVEGSLSGGVQNNTNVFADTGLSATITPSATSSKILVHVVHAGCFKTSGNSTNHLVQQVMRNGSFLWTLDSGAGYTNTALDLWVGTCAGTYLDSPATTSALTYKTQIRNNPNAAGVGICGNSSRSTIVLTEIAG